MTFPIAGLRWSLAAALLLLLAACRITAPERPAAQDAAMAPLDVVTLNIWHDRENWPRRQAIIVDELRRLKPDAILLQEVLQDNGLPNQAESLARELGYAWHFVSVDPPERTRRYGNAILTPHPILARGERALLPLDDYRIAGWVRARVRDRIVDFYVVHLNFTDRSGAVRAQQVQGLLDFIAATRGDAPVVIGGDFNAPAGNAEFASLRAEYLDSYALTHPGVDRPGVEVDAATHTTLNRAMHHAPQRIDHVFAQADAFRPEQSRRLFDQPEGDGAWASDHFGVWVRLRWNASEGRR